MYILGGISTENSTNIRYQPKVLQILSKPKMIRIRYFHKLNGHSVCQFREDNLGIKDAVLQQRSLVFFARATHSVWFFSIRKSMLNYWHCKTYNRVINRKESSSFHPTSLCRKNTARTHLPPWRLRLKVFRLPFFIFRLTLRQRIQMKVRLSIILIILAF